MKPERAGPSQLLHHMRVRLVIRFCICRHNSSQYPPGRCRAQERVCIPESISGLSKAANEIPQTGSRRKIIVL